MQKSKKVGDELIESLKEAVEIAEGKKEPSRVWKIDK